VGVDTKCVEFQGLRGNKDDILLEGTGLVIEVGVGAEKARERRVETMRSESCILNGFLSNIRL